MNHKPFNASYTSIRDDLIKYIEGKNLRVFDVGCSTGTNGVFLKKNGIASYLLGVEIDKEMGSIAKKNYDEVLIGNLEDPELLKKIPLGFFDYILLGDVLEHLVNPWEILLHLSKAIKKNGKIIISIPNIQHIDTFIHLFLKGYWPYNKRGLYDKTHLRMFTKKNIEELIEFANLKIITIERKFRFRDEIGSSFPRYGGVLKKVFPNLFTFQYIVVCRLKNIHKTE
ncbi:MAG: class I SAM-dependent methyltransferase [Desulfobacterium sp.]|nr:class I SAM-dependent methyltransferase [Desulfobacterium sp.]